MPTTKTRDYKSKDVDMLITSGTIIESAISNKVFLQAKRSTWADPFFQDIKTQIDNAIQTHLGLDNAKQLREATQVLLAIKANAQRDLAEVKVQITADFKANPTRQNEILNQLGFKTYNADAQNGDQEALINLLYQFKTNLTTALKTEIVTAGTAVATLDSITAYADSLKSADITQEGTKGIRKEISAEAVTEFNSIYNKIISICTISNKFYKGNPPLQQQFSFAKVSKALNLTKKQTPKP